MRTKSWLLAAAAAWALSIASPHPVRADLPIKPLDSKDVFSINTDPWVPDDRRPNKMAATQDQAVVDSDLDRARAQHTIKVYLFWERFFRVLRIGGIVR